MPGAQRGGPTAGHRPGSTAYRLDDHLDGRLDLDDLDAPLDLDVIGTDDDRLLLSEHWHRLLESTGVGPFLGRHRVPVVATVLVTALLLAAGAQWWMSRPVPLPDAPLLLVKTSGPDSTQVAVDPGADGSAALTLSVAVASVERTGVVVTLLGLTGPGLTPVNGEGSVVDTSVTDTVANVHASLDCAAPASSAAAIDATGTDFHVLVSRTAPEGESRRDEIRLVGGQRLAQVVRTICLQAVADRDLHVTSVTAAALPGVAAADVTVVTANDGSRTWSALRASTQALPWIVNRRPAVDLPPAGAAALRVRLWLQDCANPSAALRDGLLLRTADPADDAATMSADDEGNTIRLRLSAAELSGVERAFAALCATPAPTAVVREAIVHHGGSDSSAGTLQLTLRVSSRGAALVEVDQGTDTAGGQLSTLDAPVHLDHGLGTLHAAWTLPRCTDLIAAGVPRFSVNLVSPDESGGRRRPYLMSIGGDELTVALSRVCGAAVSSLVG